MSSRLLIALTCWLLWMAGPSSASASGANGPNVYVWDFSTRDGEVNELTRNLTEEFEEALIQSDCCTVLQRRRFSRILSQKQNEDGVASLVRVVDEQSKNRRVLEARVVIFGEVVDDVESGQVRVSVNLEGFSGKIVSKESTHFARGKRIDPESRLAAMTTLVESLSLVKSSRAEWPGLNSRGDLFAGRWQTSGEEVDASNRVFRELLAQNPSRAEVDSFLRENMSLLTCLGSGGYIVLPDLEIDSFVVDFAALVIRPPASNRPSTVTFVELLSTTSKPFEDQSMTDLVKAEKTALLETMELSDAEMLNNTLLSREDFRTFVGAAYRRKGFIVIGRRSALSKAEIFAMKEHNSELFLAVEIVTYDSLGELLCGAVQQ